MARRLAWTEHGRSEARRRGISEELVFRVASAPEQTLRAPRAREIRQSRVVDPASGKLRLLRVVVETGPGQDAIVTVYRTSKITKYWSEG